MPIERFAAVLNDLRAKILDGTYPAGEPLPRTDRLKDTYGVSTAVITRATKELKDEGLLWRVANRGMIVLPPPVPVRLSLTTAPQYEHDDWAAACHQAGLTGNIHTSRRITTIDATRPFTELFGINEGDPLVGWQRTAMVHGDVPVFHDRIFHPASVLGDAPPATLTPEAIQIARSRFDPSTSYADITTTVRPCRDKETNRLKVSEGTPIFDITRTFHDKNGRTYEMLRRIVNPLRVRLVDRGLPLTSR
ncbi:GntR family transcriptional regulator [Nonomuraea sp. NPDC049504]|uniref:GntR family transcriptional regulator n=1 Tax=Nonomuraea sp. NPDC049504 TaxID=3154729 RepID=UPI003434D6D4